MNNKITRNKDVKYYVSTGELLCILNISFNASNNRFTLKSKKSKKSVLSGIYKGKTVKDKNSKIHKLLQVEKIVKATLKLKEERAYAVLDEIRVSPNVWYLRKVRNKKNKKA